MNVALAPESRRHACGTRSRDQLQNGVGARKAAFDHVLYGRPVALRGLKRAAQRAGNRVADGVVRGRVHLERGGVRRAEGEAPENRDGEPTALFCAWRRTCFAPAGYPLVLDLVLDEHAALRERTVVVCARRATAYRARSAALYLPAVRNRPPRPELPLLGLCLRGRGAFALRAVQRLRQCEGRDAPGLRHLEQSVVDYTLGGNRGLGHRSQLDPSIVEPIGMPRVRRDRRTSSCP